MKTKILQRQGCSCTFNTNNHQNDKSDYFIELANIPMRNDKNPNGYRVELSYSDNFEKWGKQNGQLAFVSDKLLPLNEARILAEQKIKELFDDEIIISDTIEKYCFDFGIGRETSKDDVFFSCCVYEKYSDSIRLIPENYCLVAFGSEGTKDFLEMDKATEKYLPLLELAIKDYEREKGYACNKNKSEEYLKGWLTWLISERLKDEFSLISTQMETIIR